ncbi:MAG TPA: outer membrane beta-barrel protein [Gemmatimonadaceae bacterium]|nr:outer membrane beta-barrel protein [Gemmatimonadaceae bacterium]
MKRAVVAALATIGLLAVAVPAQAQLRLGAGVGLSAPTGDLGDVTSTGWHGMVVLGVQPTGMPFGIRFDGVYHSLDFDEDAVGPTDESIRILGGSANVIFIFAPLSPLRPYLSGGLGVYNVDFGDDNGDDDSQTKFGLNGGLGIQAALTGFSMFAEVRYLTIFTDESNANLFPLTVGFMFGR